MGIDKHIYFERYKFHAETCRILGIILMSPGAVMVRECFEGSLNASSWGIGYSAVLFYFGATLIFTSCDIIDKSGSRSES